MASDCHATLSRMNATIDCSRNATSADCTLGLPAPPAGTSVTWHQLLNHNLHCAAAEFALAQHQAQGLAQRQGNSLGSTQTAWQLAQIQLVVVAVRHGSRLVQSSPLCNPSSPPVRHHSQPPALLPLLWLAGWAEQHASDWKGDRHLSAIRLQIRLVDGSRL